VRERFGPDSPIQRCHQHKQRNIEKYLPKKHHKLLALKLTAAWGMTQYAQARKELQKVHDWLASIHLAAAKSLDEGFDETLASDNLQAGS